MVDRFAAAVAATGAGAHRAGSLEEARARARELVGEATVARFADPELDGIARVEAPPGEAEVSLVRAAFGVASTGAFGLVHGPGRARAAGVLPERQVALLAAGEVCETLAEALARAYAREAPSAIVLVAGPSRTSDIEQRSIVGVHAPARIDVIVFGAPEGPVPHPVRGPDARGG